MQRALRRLNDDWVSRVVDRGGIELTLGAIWLSASIFAFARGYFELRCLIVDCLAAVALVVGVRHPRIASIALMLLMLAAVASEHGEQGFVGVFSFLLVVTLLRRGLLRFALVHTAVTFVLGSLLSWEASGWGSLEEPVFGWFTAGLSTWAIGIGFRFHAQLSAARERERTQRERMELLWDLHDFVARDLTVITLRADAAIARGEATLEDLQSIGLLSRGANQFLRDTAQQIEDPAGQREYRAVTVASAVEAAREALAAQGRELEDHRIAGCGSRLQDAVAGRVLAEALHNAVKHGIGTVTLDMTCGPQHIEFIVRNTRRPGHAATAGMGLGTRAMAERLRAFGGSLESGPVGQAWVSRIRLANTPSGLGGTCPTPNQGEHDQRGVVRRR